MKVGNLSILLDSNWTFHSSHFSAFSSGVKNCHDYGRAGEN